MTTKLVSLVVALSIVPTEAIAKDCTSTYELFEKIYSAKSNDQLRFMHFNDHVGCLPKKYLIGDDFYSFTKSKNQNNVQPLKENLIWYEIKKEK